MVTSTKSTRLHHIFTYAFLPKESSSKHNMLSYLESNRQGNYWRGSNVSYFSCHIVIVLALQRLFCSFGQNYIKGKHCQDHYDYDRKNQIQIRSLRYLGSKVECYIYTWCISISLIALNVFQMQDSKIFSRRCKGCQIKYLFNWFYLDLAVCVHTNTSNSVQESFLPSLVFTIFLAPYRGLNWQYMHIWSDSVIILKRGGQQKQKNKQIFTFCN